MHVFNLHFDCIPVDSSIQVVQAGMKVVVGVNRENAYQTPHSTCHIRSERSKLFQSERLGEKERNLKMKSSY
jgi:hypothetical protein